MAELYGRSFNLPYDSGFDGMLFSAGAAIKRRLVKQRQTAEAVRKEKPSEEEVSMASVDYESHGNGTSQES